MKYLKLLEAFNSNSISRMMGFLKNKNIKFLELQLKNIMSSFDIPLSEIEDKDIEYLTSKKAINIKAPEEWKKTNPQASIYAIKFWFSLNEFLGVTGIGNRSDDRITFDSSDKHFIEDTLGIKTGKLERVTNYTMLKTGDTVICRLSVGRSNSLVMGTIFIEDNNTYIIQDVQEGSTPNNKNYKKYGRYSWIIKDDNSIQKDHSKLHIYINSDDKIVYDEDIMSFNLPISHNFLDNWKNSGKTDIIGNSYFCFIIYIDNIIKRGDIKKISDIRKDRVEGRKNATNLIPNVEHLMINRNRYDIKKLETQFGITKDVNTYKTKNLEKILLLSKCYKYPIYFRHSNNYCAAYLDSFLSRLKRYNAKMTDLSNRNVDAPGYRASELQIMRLYDEFLSNYVSFNSYVENVLKSINNSEKLIFNFLIGSPKDVFIIIREINMEITNFIKSQKIDNVDDLYIFINDLNLIQNMTLNYSEYISNIFRTIGHKDLSYYLREYMSTDDEIIDNDLKELTEYKDYIKHMIAMKK